MVEPKGKPKKKKEVVTIELESDESDSIETTRVSNSTEEKKKMGKIAKKCARVERELEKMKMQLDDEKSTKRKLYKTMVKLARELKDMKEQRDQLPTQTWYDGGVWRAPQILPRIEEDPDKNNLEPVSLTELFFDLVIVTAFSRAGSTVSNMGELNWPIVANFAIFWFIWVKEASYKTRFDTSDISSQFETLLTCFVVLYGTFSISGDFAGSDCTKIMVTAALISAIHFLLHVRVAFSFRNADGDTSGSLAKKYAIVIMVLTTLETITWIIGVFFIPEDSPKRSMIFFIGIFFSLRIPKAFLANDFHAASSKRGVLFLLLLGFLLQNVVIVAAPFFDFDPPSDTQYAFLGSTCFLLFCIKLLYVNDNTSIDPKDHALLVNRMAGFLFQIGQFTLLLATTTLGSGLGLLTHSFLASTAALSDNSRTLVTGGFSGVIASIFLIKSMHVRRVPIDATQKCLFYTAYGIEVFVYVAITTLTAYLAFAKNTIFSALNEMETLFFLSGLALFAVVMSWLDEAIEMSLYGSSSDALNYRVSAFGFFSCCLADEDEDEWGSLSSPSVGMLSSESASLLEQQNPSETNAKGYSSLQDLPSSVDNSAKV